MSWLGDIGKSVSDWWQRSGEEQQAQEREHQRFLQDEIKQGKSELRAGLDWDTRDPNWAMKLIPVGGVGRIVGEGAPIVEAVGGGLLARIFPRLFGGAARAAETTAEAAPAVTTAGTAATEAAADDITLTGRGGAANAGTAAGGATLGPAAAAGRAASAGTGFFSRLWAGTLWTSRAQRIANTGFWTRFWDGAWHSAGGMRTPRMFTRAANGVSVEVRNIGGKLGGYAGFLSPTALPLRAAFYLARLPLRIGRAVVGGLGRGVRRLALGTAAVGGITAGIGATTGDWQWWNYFKTGMSYAASGLSWAAGKAWAKVTGGSSTPDASQDHDDPPSTALGTTPTAPPASAAPPTTASNTDDSSDPNQDPHPQPAATPSVPSAAAPSAPASAQTQPASAPVSGSTPVNAVPDNAESLNRQELAKVKAQARAAGPQTVTAAPPYVAGVPAANPRAPQSRMAAGTGDGEGSTKWLNLQELARVKAQARAASSQTVTAAPPYVASSGTLGAAAASRPDYHLNGMLPAMPAISTAPSAPVTQPPANLNASARPGYNASYSGLKADNRFVFISQDQRDYYGATEMNWSDPNMMKKYNLRNGPGVTYTVHN